MKTKNCEKILSTFLFILSITNLTGTVTAQKAEKKISPWYIYNKNSSFEDLAPYKEMIGSISIFGNPPKTFIDACHQHGIEVYHAVGGNEETINTPAKIKEVAEQYLNDCLENGYDGIDLDFEHLDPKIQPQYSNFLQEVSKKLHGARKKLSHCVGYYKTLYEDETPIIFYDPEVIGKTCDLVRVMCYDLYFAPGRNVKELENRDDCQGIGPTSNYLFTKSAITFWLKYVSKEKLVMGLPAYSNDYTIDLTGGGKQVYAAVPDSVCGNLPKPIWQYLDKLNIYLYRATDGKPHLFYASDEKSTQSLMEIGDELHIYNIGFWHFSSVDPKTWNIVKEWTMEH